MTESGRRVCGAKTRDGDPCKNTAVMPNGRCRMHGGSTPSGTALPQTTHGRYSKHLPTRLKEGYEKAMADRDLLAMRDGIALLDARIEDLLARVDVGESLALWRELKKTYQAFQKARRDRDGVAMQEAFAELGRLIERGRMDFATWWEIDRVLESRRKATETEMRRVEKLHQMMTTEQAAMLVAALQDAVERHVPEDDRKRAIAEELRRLL